MVVQICDKMAYKTSVIQYFFYFASILNFKVQNIILGKLYLANIRVGNASN
jgi:hypothetical protein